MTQTSKSSEALDRPGMFRRLHLAFGPVFGGLILDLADFATFGPLGLYLGAIVGAAVGFWISSLYGFRLWMRILWVLLAAAYCTAPFTEFLPLATLISAVARFLQPPASK
ncbi:MAG: hypothetical protein DWQ01_01630 [Planctomycetota bacterium]|nr:MAG: hypothetical protein DWQ01_01630 [Planctomycetota bacterium]